MPLYEYRCKACKQVFEYIQSFSSRPKRKCEECSGKLEKLISRSGFVLKGTGWYETDFKGDSKPDKSEGSDSKESASSGDGEGSSKSSDKAKSASGKKSSKKTDSSPKKKKGGTGD